MFQEQKLELSLPLTLRNCGLFLRINPILGRLSFMASCPKLGVMSLPKQTTRKEK